MCDTVVVVGHDRVLFGKNSDRDPNEAQLLEWHPARHAVDPRTVRCTWISIPDVSHTNAVLISRPYWMWGAEMGANEHGVVIGNEAVFTRQPYAESGLTGMDLLRLALERARSAAEAVSVIVALLERYGQGGGCGHENRTFTYHNSFLVADAAEAWVLETAGRHWADERVTSGVRSISNGLTIPGFADRYADRLRTAVARAHRRRALTGRLGNAASAGTVMHVLRSHGADRKWPRYSLLTGALSAPCAHAGGLLTATQTTASWVADLGDGGARHWVTATAAPCTSLYKPVTVTEAVDLGPACEDRFDDGSLWWRHERFHRAAVRDPAKTFPLFAAERDAVEQSWLRDPPAGADAFAGADRLLERWTHAVEAAAADDRRPRFVRRYWAERDRRAHAGAATAPTAP